MADSAGRKRKKRPSAKETRARMSQAFATPSPISRTGEQPGGATGSEGTPPARERGVDWAPERRRRGASPEEGAEKLVRLSVDVPRSQHRFLRVLAAESGVTGMAVVRALLEEAAVDEELVRRVRDRLGAS